MNLTPENRTRCAPIFWWVLIIAMTIPPGIIVFQNIISHSGALCLIALFVSLCIWLVIISRTKVFCRLCSSPVERDEITVDREKVKNMIKTYELKKPLLFHLNLKGKCDWRFTVLKCKNCDYQRVIDMGPYDVG